MIKSTRKAIVAYKRVSKIQKHKICANLSKKLIKYAFCKNLRKNLNT